MLATPRNLGNSSKPTRPCESRRTPEGLADGEERISQRAEVRI
jgi:hypothetical protein